MIDSWLSGLVVGLQTLNEILAAGIAITAFSLLLYALSFNLRDRVVRSFAIILVSVVIIFTAGSIGSVVTAPSQISFWLRLQWVGLIFLPPSYLFFSDALLSTTGKPSRGKRVWAVRLTYVFSFLIFVSFPYLPWLGPIELKTGPVPHFTGTFLTYVFTLYYMLCMIAAWINFIRAFRRTTTSTSRRRMGYLVIGSMAPALGLYPFLLFGFIFGLSHMLIYWLLVSLTSLIVGLLIVIMAYSVAFFGVPWPDRVVKSRLVKWLMRGPFTASVVLGITTLIRRGGAIYGLPYTAAVPIAMVVFILLIEFGITLLAPTWERWLFYGKDRADLLLLENLEDRLLTSNDLNQFLEILLAAVCDRLQVSRAFIASLVNGELEMVVTTGAAKIVPEQAVSSEIIQEMGGEGGEEYFRWGEYCLVPLKPNGDSNHKLLGILGFIMPDSVKIDEEQQEALTLLANRAGQALLDRGLQEQVFQSLQQLQPQVELIQQMRAAAQYDGSTMLDRDIGVQPEGIALWVKDALTHYWGGPKLTDSPLVNLKIVQNAIDEHDGNTANALRAILRQAVDRVKPDGERRFTGEWILYNILELKFMEGRKVREVAMRLAMSEADLYRKQRVAIESVAKAILEMEEQVEQN